MLVAFLQLLASVATDDKTYLYVALVVGTVPLALGGVAQIIKAFRGRNAEGEPEPSSVILRLARDLSDQDKRHEEEMTTLRAELESVKEELRKCRALCEATS